MIRQYGNGRPTHLLTVLPSYAANVDRRDVATRVPVEFVHRDGSEGVSTLRGACPNAGIETTTGRSVEHAPGRERVITALGIVAVVAFSWAYSWTGAGIGMSALEMTVVALFPHRLADGGGRTDPSLPTVVLMWWVMMIAMMAPSAAPLVLLYRRVLRHHAAYEARSAVPSLFLPAGYRPHGWHSQPVRHR